MEIIILAILFFSGLIFGTINERNHYRSIQKREAEQIQRPLINFGKNYNPDYQDYHGELVTANVVISIDYFKKFVANISNLIGGRVVSYETLLDRARREAILRLKESCPDAEIIINTRFETSSISKSAQNSVTGIEVLVFGTALYRVN